ncbi:MAG: hypothetical protein GVY36_15135 [Verrucomicrobia bacterium]|jgi:tRNA A-37 threonylcarbamoyl transferase component Bud32|nr:hypothetical protein [Verrucomicrobiota bacterium]
MINSRSITPETPDNFLDLSYADVDVLFESGEIIKEGKTQDVRLCRIQGKTLIVKCYRAQGLLSAFRILIRLSRPHKSLRYSYLLRKRGIACPAHYLVVARNTLRYARTFLLIERVAGPNLYDFLYSKDPLTLSEKTAQAAIHTIKSLHSLGFTHGDLHAQNIVVKNETTVQLIDLDNVRKNRRRQEKDIARFKKSVEDGTQNREILLEKINAQL